MDEAVRSKKPKKMTEKRLQNIALYYCQHYVVSRGKLEDYLRNRVYREVKEDLLRKTMLDYIGTVVSTMEEFGYVNDKEAASAKLRGALRAGNSLERSVYLARKKSMVAGCVVEGELDAALENTLDIGDVDEIKNAGGDAKMALAALQKANRGPFRMGRVDDKTKRQDFAWLQRRGYRLEDIKTAMRMED